MLDGPSPASVVTTTDITTIVTATDTTDFTIVTEGNSMLSCISSTPSHMNRHGLSGTKVVMLGIFLEANVFGKKLNTRIQK